MEGFVEWRKKEVELRPATQKEEKEDLMYATFFLQQSCSEETPMTQISSLQTFIWHVVSHQWWCTATHAESIDVLIYHFFDELLLFYGVYTILL